jgi:hypothetical protein
MKSQGLFGAHESHIVEIAGLVEFLGPEGTCLKLVKRSG